MALFVFNARVRLVDQNLSWTSPDDFHTKHCSMKIMVDSCLYTSEEWSDVIRVMTGCIRMNHADEEISCLYGTSSLVRNIYLST